MLQPKYTMNGLEVKDQMSANGSLHSRVLRIVLKSHLVTLQPKLEKTIAGALAEELASGTKLTDGWTAVYSFAMAKNVIRTTNSSVFFGDHLSKDPKFLEAAMQYPDDLLFASEVLRFIPTILAPVAAPILMRQSRGQKALVKYLVPMIEGRLRNPASGDPPQTKSVDCIQWMIDINPRKDPWSVEKIVQVILGLWFASVHQLAISLVYALEDLCRHSEYIGLLREELETHRTQTGGIDLENLPLLDSFLKESARLHPSDSISIRRKALLPYTFSDGTHIAAGDVACVPLRAIMRDPCNFPDSTTFDGFRFVAEDRKSSISKYTDGDATFLLWGLGRRAWSVFALFF
jgi:cytochrome P450